MLKSNQKTWKLIEAKNGFYLQLKIKRDTIIILKLNKEEGEFIKDRSWTYETTE